MQKCIIVVKLCLLFMLVLAVDKGFAESVVSEYSFKPSEQSALTLDGYDIQISNSESSTFTINSNGESMEEISIENASFTKVFYWKKDNASYLLLENRKFGTGGFTQFVIFELSNGVSKQIFLSNDYKMATIDVTADLVEVIYVDDATSAVDEMKQLKDIYKQGADGTLTLVEEGLMVHKVSENTGGGFTLQSTTGFVGTNPTVAELNIMLTEEAIKAGVPPELVKAIAWQESTWRQFRTNNAADGSWKIGDPIVSFDGGIGIMQITEPNMSSERERRLKEDIRYNIQEGLKILKDKWTYSNWGRIPKINGNDMLVIEDWYFAVMAYNGISRRNDPQYYPGNTYQDVIYRHIERLSQVTTTKFPEQLLRNDIYYTTAGSLHFRKPHYHISGPFQTSKHHFNTNDLVKATESGVRLRTSPEGAEIRKTIAGETLQIVGPYQAGNNASNQFVWYPVKDLSSNQTYFIASSYLESIRIAGVNRYATAVGISQAGWDKADTVVLARGDNFPDALAGTPLAYQLDAPILLTRSNQLSEETRNEIVRLGAKKVVILGGTNAVTPTVETALRNMGIEVDRIAGINRFETAKLIANAMGTNFSTVVVANGYGFPDALAIAPYAARNGIPILLTEKTYIPGPTKTMLSQASNTIVVGGDAVIANNLLRSMPSATRIAGQTRYETAYKIGTSFNFTANEGLAVNGRDFPDALTGSVLAAKRNAPLLLVAPTYLPVETQRLAQEKGFNQISVLGGNEAVQNNSILMLMK